jgi:hypothetical protein
MIPPPKEYIITEWQLVRTESKEIRDAVRSRPHTPAPVQNCQCPHWSIDECLCLEQEHP